MMVRWEVFATVGCLDENYFLYFEETDFCYRAKQKGFATWYVPESRVMHIAGQSTKVTERDAKPRRFPPYWFESRRRFFSTTYGLPYAVVTDLMALLAFGLGSLKRVALGQKGGAIPHFASDLIKYSVIWPSNRRLAPVECAMPGGLEQHEQPENS
jgi:hypothetical protein